MRRLGDIAQAAWRTAPGGPLARTRLLFLFVTLLSAAQSLLAITVSPADDSRLVTPAYIALLALVVWWSRPSRLARCGPVAEVIEACGYVVVLAGVSELNNSLAILFIALAYRSLYGSAARAMLRAGLYMAAFVASYAIAGTLAERLTEILFLIPVLPMCTLLTFSVAGIVNRQERSAARESALVRASPALVATELPDEACRVLADVAVSLAQSPARADVWLWSEGELVKVASAGERTPGPTVVDT
ncbi:MAG TPA: hypothetical protein VML96_00060, partial [Egibacteraceae bacterium]|nr:hypothetical protein [Egibacteraceae bacterium]